MKIYAGIFALLILFSLPGQAAALGLEAAVGGWRQDPEGDLAYEGLTDLDSIDLDKEANYDKETGLQGRVKIDMPLPFPNIYVMATPMEFDGTGRKTVPFTFGDLNFDANVPFSSKVKLDHYDFAFFWGVPLLKTATLEKLNAEFGLNIRVLDLSAEVSQPDTNTFEEVDETLGLPMLYLALQFRPLERISLEAEGRGIAYSGNHYYDLIGRIKLNLLGPAFLAGGWRHEDLEIDEDDIEAELTFSGPFLEAGFSF